VDFLEFNLPPLALKFLVPMIVPSMTTKLSEEWLERYIPSGTENLDEYANLIAAAQRFEATLHRLGWTTETSLHNWSGRAGELWGRRHNTEILHRIQIILRAGVVPTARLTASPGAISSGEYRVAPSSVSSSNENLSDWAWDEDWTSPLPVRRNSRNAVVGIPKTYECTAIAGPLLTVLGGVLQEYTHLREHPIIQSARLLYPDLIRKMVALYRAAVVLHATVQADIPLRLVNDCRYLAGEIGLMTLGMSHLGLNEITSVLEELRQTMESSAVTWRDRYLVIHSITYSDFRLISSMALSNVSELRKGSFILLAQNEKNATIPSSQE